MNELSVKMAEIRERIELARERGENFSQLQDELNELEAQKKIIDSM